MATVLSEIRVGFHGEGAGTGELTWGQMGIWRASQRNNRTMNLAWTAAPHEGASVTEIAGMLRFMVSRHPALRTRLRFTDGPSGERHPRQVTVASGEVPLCIADIGDGDDPAAAAAALRTRYEFTWFDYENEFPVRMGVIRQSGAVTHLVVCYSHVAVDGGGLDALNEDLENLDWATGEAKAPIGGLSPLDLARRQGGPADQRRSERAVRHWAAQLDRLSAWRHEGPARPHEPRFAELMAYSPAMELGIRAVAARTGTDATSVLLAAYSAAVARVFGRDPSLAQLVVNNRFRPGFGRMVSQVSQHSICVVDVAGAAFDEVVARAKKAAVSATYHAYYDPVACDGLLDEIAARRGQPLDVHWCLNDLRGMAEPADGNVPAEVDLTRIVPRTRMYWSTQSPACHGDLYLFVDSVPQRLGVQAPAEGLPAVYMKVWADARHFALDQVEALVREMEAIVVAACPVPKLADSR
jgi:hypothetical protein